MNIINATFKYRGETFNFDFTDNDVVIHLIRNGRVVVISQIAKDRYPHIDLAKVLDGMMRSEAQ